MRYVFLFYIVAFFFVNESKQKLLILAFHLTAFTILIHDSRSASVVSIAAASLILLVAANFAVKYIYSTDVSSSKEKINGNEKLWNDAAFLMTIGIVTLTRLTITRPLGDSLALMQTLWFAVAITAMLAIPLALKIVRKFEKLTYIYVLVSILLISSTLLLGQEQYGAVNWIMIAGISFQASEFVKILFVFYLASVFRKPPDYKKIIVSGTFTATIVLLLVLSVDLGGALIFFITYMLVLYAATGNIFLFSAGMISASVAAYVAYELFPHIRVRVNAWRDPWRYIDTDGYQIALGFFSIGTFGIFGSGLTLGDPNFNAVVERDMIFVAISEEFGSLFGGMLILLYLNMFYKGMQIAMGTTNRSHSLLATGIVSMMAFQTFLILGGILTVVPLTGVTLPLISYGGSSVVATIAKLGVLQWIYIRSQGGENF